MKPQLSIIIPCYNCASTLVEAVDSCFRQGLDKDSFEIVMVDDGSTDNTCEIMENLSKKYPEIRLFYHEKNRGGGATRNTAVEKSKADIIFCLDSDDMLGDNTLSKMVNYLNEKKCDGVGISTSIKFNGKDLNNVSYINHFGYIGQKIPISSLFEKDKDKQCALYSTFLITKNVFERIGGYPTNHGFDTQGLAFRFLAGGFTAYTCPNTVYHHRINHSKSYYMREYESGKVNYNWKLIFEEFIYLFNNSIKELILNFNVNSEKNLFSELVETGDLLIDDYEKLLMPKEQIIDSAKKNPNDIYWSFWLGNNDLLENKYSTANIYLNNSIDNGGESSSATFKIIQAKNNGSIDIKLYPEILYKQNVPYKKYGSSLSITSRIIRKFIKILKSKKMIYFPLLHVYIFFTKCRTLLSEGNEYRIYKQLIKNIINEKEIILDIAFGGIGDWLIYTSLPRLLKQRYDVSFFLSEASVKRLRNNDTFKLCFELNPYFKGIKKTLKPFKLRTFARENGVWEFITDKGGKSYTEIIEKQFGITGKGLPEIFYKPVFLEKFRNIILIDKNYISGKKLGWLFKENIFENEAQRIKSSTDIIEYINPKAQDLFSFVDMLYSCKYYIGTSSGGASISACLDKSFSVILPYNALNGSIYRFCYGNSKAKYLS